MLQITTPKIIPTATFLKGDVLAVLGKLPSAKYDLIVTSPPYNIGKIYERSTKLTFEQYIDWLDKVIGKLVDAVQDHGSICWQVGSFIKDGEVFPIDIHTYDSFKRRGMKLRNRIVWRFNFGLHSRRRLSGRYETILWFTKSDDYRFNLDAVRVPQLYPGKRHSKKRARNYGKPSGNPLGKNPSDYWEFSAEKHFQDDQIWDIPNVKANHPEKTIHPCQFPVELVERCVLALTDPGDAVLDPFMGTGTTAIAAMKHNRNAVGIDTHVAFGFLMGLASFDLGLTTESSCLRIWLETTSPFRPCFRADWSMATAIAGRAGSGSPHESSSDVCPLALSQACLSALFSRLPISNLKSSNSCNILRQLQLIVGVERCQDLKQLSY